MSTGACGIDCDTCRLHRRGVCGSCGGGTTSLGSLKIDVQKKLFGSPCPILACAQLNRLDFCLADCDRFPCENFSPSAGRGYPYSSGFIAMQKRRREELEHRGGQEDQVAIADQHWQELGSLGSSQITKYSGARLSEDGTLMLLLFNRRVRVSITGKTVELQSGAGWTPAPALLGLVTVIYLKEARLITLVGRWISEKDLSCREFFRGIHQLQTGQILDRFGDNPADFIRAAEALGGVLTDDAGDAAVRLWVFPTVPVKLILWCSDDELPPALTVLFDQSIDELLPGDGIWAMVTMICEVLVRQADKKF